MSNKTGDGYSEVQAMALWSYAMVIVPDAIGLWVLFSVLREYSHDADIGYIIATCAVVILFSAIVLNLMYIRTTVGDTKLSVTFGKAFPCYTRTVPLSDIESAEAVTYLPLKEYGGWGIRIRLGSGDGCLSVQGNQAVRLALRNGHWLLIGSKNPNALAAEIRMRTA